MPRRPDDRPAASRKPVAQRPTEERLERGRAEDEPIGSRPLASSPCGAEGVEAENRAVESGAVESGDVQNGAVENGAVENGAVENGAVENGAVENGAVENGAVENGAVENGAVENGAAGEAREEGRASGPCPDPRSSDRQSSEAALGTFEEEMAALEEAVDALERGSLTLDMALERFEIGCRSMRRCYGILQSARKRIEILSAELGDLHRGADPGRWQAFELRDLSPGYPGPAAGEAGDGEDREATEEA